MKTASRFVLVSAAAAALMASASAQVTFYEREGFQGRSFSTEYRVSNLDRFGFNDRASSVVVSSDRWEVCSDAMLDGTCRVLKPGRYPSLASLGLDDRVSSVRRLANDEYVESARYAPEPVVAADYRRRRNERLYVADVTSVRAVMGDPERRCWVEREQVRTERNSSAPAGLAGAVIGGIIGHQIGGGSGRDVATAGGAVAGAVIGSRLYRDQHGNEVVSQDVRRCETVQNQRPAYWDVTYVFRGVQHHVQMTSAPGNTITVNREGEPRSAA